MLKSEREARLNRVKALGRIACVILRSSKIEGMLTYDGRISTFGNFRTARCTLNSSSHFDRAHCRRNISAS
jgi:hypothetical protein